MPVIYGAGCYLAKSISRHLNTRQSIDTFKHKDFRILLPTVIAEAMDANTHARHIEHLTAALQRDLALLATDVPAFAVLAGNFSEVISNAIGFNSYTSITSASQMGRIIRRVKSQLKKPNNSHVSTEQALIAAFTGRLAHIYESYFSYILRFQSEFLRRLSISLNKIGSNNFRKIQSIKINVTGHRLVDVYKATAKAFTPIISKNDSDDLLLVVSSLETVYDSAGYTEEYARDIAKDPAINVIG